MTPFLELDSEGNIDEMLERLETDSQGNVVDAIEHILESNAR